jgi:hypothetical protein
MAEAWREFLSNIWLRLSVAAMLLGWYVPHYASSAESVG